MFFVMTGMGYRGAKYSVDILAVWTYYGDLRRW